MALTRFETVFDASRFHAWGGLAIGLTFIAIGGFLLLNPPIVQRWARAYPRQIPTKQLGLTLALCASLWLAFILLSQQHINAEYRSVLENGKFKIVEGLIHDVWYRFKSAGFSIKNVHFSYAYSIDTGGYNGFWFANPIHNGVYARVTYVDNVIIRLAIKG